LFARSDRHTQVLKELKKDKSDKKKIDAQKKKIDDFTTKMKLAEKLAGVALGTSRLNYIDPRITLAWCKEAEFDYKRLFPKTQQVCGARARVCRVA
jgi:DNA topoisomerase-1